MSAKHYLVAALAVVGAATLVRGVAERAFESYARGQAETALGVLGQALNASAGQRRTPLQKPAPTGDACVDLLALADAPDDFYSRWPKEYVRERWAKPLLESDARLAQCLWENADGLAALAVDACRLGRKDAVEYAQHVVAEGVCARDEIDARSARARAEHLDYLQQSAERMNRAADELAKQAKPRPAPGASAFERLGCASRADGTVACGGGGQR